MSSYQEPDAQFEWQRHAARLELYYYRGLRVLSFWAEVRCPPPGVNGECRKVVGVTVADGKFPRMFRVGSDVVSWEVAYKLGLRKLRKGGTK